MKILMITSEAVPFIKSGGLADVVTALSHELIEHGHDVRMVLPFYKDITLSGSERTTKTCTVPMGSEREECSLVEYTLEGLPCYFLDSPLFRDRKGIYGESTHAPYPDNLYRYAMFNKAVIAMCEELGWVPDVFHCHDWTTGFIPSLMRGTDSCSASKSIMTIHNLGYQGDFSKHEINMIGLSAGEVFTEEDIDYSSRLNMLKIGIELADAVTTVSPTYAKEIQTKEFGHDLEGILQKKQDVLYGILNGIDYTEWDPATDAYIPHQFSLERVGDKELNKRELQKYCGFPVNPAVPVFGMVSRIADQKGFRELCSGSPSVLERMIMNMDAQFVIVGTGDRDIEEYLKDLSRTYDNFSAQIVFNNYIAHLVEAGSDFFLMPSRYEPCGLNQIYSLKYGTLPIVRKTGGLADTIEPMDGDYTSGTGFVFDQMSGEAIYDAVEQAYTFWGSPNETVTAAKVRAMSKSFTWRQAAEDYCTVYNNVI